MPNQLDAHVFCVISLVTLKKFLFFSSMNIEVISNEKKNPFLKWRKIIATALW